MSDMPKVQTPTWVRDGDRLNWWAPLCRHIDIKEVAMRKGDQTLHATRCEWCHRHVCDHDLTPWEPFRLIERWQVRHYENADCRKCLVALSRHVRTEWRKRREIFKAFEIIREISLAVAKQKAAERQTRGLAMTCSIHVGGYVSDELAIEVAEIVLSNSIAAAKEYAALKLQQ